MINKASNWVAYCLSKIPQKKTLLVCDLACGYGRNSVFLASNGLKVVSVDINLHCLKSFNDVNIIKLQADIEKVLNWPLRNNIFDIVVVTNFLNRSIFKNIEASVKKNGFLIYETFGEGQEKFGKPKNKNFLLKKNELLSLTNSLQLIFYEEVKVISRETKFIKKRILCQNV